MRSPASLPTTRTTIAARSVNRTADGMRFAHIGSRSSPDKSTRESGSAVRSSPRAAPRWNSGAFFMIPTREPRTASGSLTLRFGPDGRCSVLHEYWHGELDVAIDPAEDWFSPRPEKAVRVTNSSRIPG